MGVHKSGPLRRFQHIDPHAPPPRPYSVRTLRDGGQHRYVIVDGRGRRLTGVHASRWRAWETLDELERHLRQRRRPCLTCGETFLSEGAHNRMCARCRRGDGANDAEAA